MKFGQKVQSLMVPEWRAKYINYKQLKKVIKAIRESALSLAKAYSDIKNVTGKEQEMSIDMRELKAERHFCELLDIDVNTVNQFYNEKLKEMNENFHALTIAAIRLGLISEYIPMKKGFTTKIEREISRIDGGIKVVQHDEDQRRNTFVSETDSKFPLRKITIHANDEESVDQRSNATLVPTDMIETIELHEMNVSKAEQHRISKKKLRQSFREYYRGLILLEGYCMLNLEAIEKILKKHDKNTGIISKDNYIKTVICKQDFYSHSPLKLLISETELLFAQAFTEGHRSQAMEKLRVPKEQKQVGTSTWLLGLNVGLTIPIVLFIIYLATAFDSDLYPRVSDVIISYRMFAMAILLVWGWGIDMYIWEKYHINYVFIFEFDQRQHVRYQHILGAASIFTAIWAYSLFFYMFSSISLYVDGLEWLFKIPWQFFPLSMLCLLLVLFMVFQIRTKYWLLRTLLDIVASPFRPVYFRDFFLADQINSLVIVLYDFEFVMCFFSYDAWTGTAECAALNPWTRPLFAIIPAAWRFIQCIRRYYDCKDVNQLWNAGKYSTTFLVAIFSVLRANTNITAAFYLWLLFIVVSTCYTFYWDIVKDWSLGQKEHGYLRPNLTYPKYAYYWAMGSNLVLRLLWTLTISPDSIGIVTNPILLTTILASLEIIRRAQWNLFRLENEQLNNVGKFRAINILVPLTDFHYDDYVAKSRVAH